MEMDVVEGVSCYNGLIESPVFISWLISGNVLKLRI